MSQNESITLPCPKCAHEETVLLWRGLNTVEDAAAKEDLFEGKLNIYECTACGFKSLVPAPFLYDDPLREVSSQFFPFELTNHEEFYGGFKPDGKADHDVSEGMDVPEYVHNRHIVFEMGELLRYVIFRERLWGLNHPEAMAEAGFEPGEAVEDSPVEAVADASAESQAAVEPPAEDEAKDQAIQ